MEPCFLINNRGICLYFNTHMNKVKSIVDQNEKNTRRIKT